MGQLWHNHVHIYTAGGSSGRDGSYHFQTRYLTNITCMAEVRVGLVISCLDMIFDKYYLRGRGLGGFGHIMPRHDIICIQPAGAAPEFRGGMRGLRADIAF